MTNNYFLEMRKASVMSAPKNLSLEMHEVFTPGSPINHRDFFKGRVQQVRRILDTIPSPGRHPIVFGQRGVGKTSLVNILTQLLPNYLSVKVTCDSSDTFKTIWNRVLQKVTVNFKTTAFGFSRQVAEEKTNLAAFLGKDNGLHSADVAGILAALQQKAIFVIDEFDRITDTGVKSAMADLLKNLSDNNPNATLVLVGVGESITDLIGVHPSVSRNLVQVEMPLMTGEEIKEIVSKGAERLALNIDGSVLQDVAYLSGGFPHYAHLLGLSICKACVIRDIDTIDQVTFSDLACSLAVEESIETYRQAFSKATKTSKASRYQQILCACGAAVHDDRGVFRATDVVGAMADLFGDQVNVQAVVPALQAFAEHERGCVLEKIPFGSQSHYRLREPLMRPFLRIKSRGLEVM